MIRVPTLATLRKYGISLDEWRTILDEQDGVCPVCHTEPPTGRLVVDHQHVKDWKKMPPEERKKYIRGLVCTVDNHFVLSRYLTVGKARNAADYLERYESRRGRDRKPEVFR